MQKEYRPTASDNDELFDRKAHEEEMQRALIRLEKTKKRRINAFICAGMGFILGILYVFWIAYGANMMLTSGQSLYGAYIALAGESQLAAFLLDFAPPYVLGIIFALVFSRKEKGKLYFVFTTLLMLTIIIAIFMLYMSLMGAL